MDTKKMLFFGKAKGSVYLVVVLVTAIILSVMAMSAAKVNQVAMDSFGSTKKMLQAQQYAASEAEVLRLTGQVSEKLSGRWTIRYSCSLPAHLVYKGGERLCLDMMAMTMTRS